jgi:hypothetical protein
MFLPLGCRSLLGPNALCLGAPILLDAFLFRGGGIEAS